MVASRNPLKHLFLDRDGTVIMERHYLSNPDLVKLEHGAAEALSRFARAGYRLVIVSNQSGIARGYFGEEELATVNARLRALLAAQGVAMAAWYHCPHAAEDGCGCRKPKPGMLDAAARDCPVDWASSLLVGDKLSDLETAHARGMKGYLVAPGHGGALVKGFQGTCDTPVFPNLQAVADHFFAQLND